MNMKYAVYGIALAAFAAPALAASAFYVVQNSATMKCSIVEEKPVDATMKHPGWVCVPAHPTNDASGGAC